MTAYDISLRLSILSTPFQNDAIEISASYHSHFVQFSAEDRETILDISIPSHIGCVSSESPKMVNSGIDLTGKTIR